MKKRKDYRHRCLCRNSCGGGCGVASRAVRVEDGRRIRKAFNEYAERVVRLRESDEFEDSDDDPALSDWFTAPEGFLPVKDGNVYKSVINPYDTPEEWICLKMR